MLPVSVNYDIWPSVVPADKECEMTIAPSSKAFLLFEGKEYTVKIISVDTDEFTYKNPQTHKYLKAIAHDGSLKFKFTFEKEQEHIVILYDNEEKLLREMRIYSLYEDLYALTPLMGDFHGHSYRSDGKHDPCDVISQYREQGYDFFTIPTTTDFTPAAR